MSEDKYIRCKNITKTYHGRTGPKEALKDVSFEINRGENIGILGHNGAGKSTLIRILSGSEKQSSGSIDRKMSLSWPLAFHGGFHSSLTGVDNVKFLSRVYQVDFKETLEFVRDFSELGKDLREPFKAYSSGMMAKLAFSLTLAIDFDCLLVDEVLSVGDAKFQQKCHDYIGDKLQDRSLILVSHHPDVIRNYCDKACILHQGHMFETEDIDRAYHDYDGLVNEYFKKQN